MRENFWLIVLAGVCIIAGIVAVLHITALQDDCEKRGGVLVRTVAGLACAKLERK